ncbi:MAG: DUF3306 domain-containing protein [Hyphomicrobiales bacterium]
MTESDKFLSRWSRLKQEATRDAEAPKDASGVEPVREIESAASAVEATAEGHKEPEVDLSTLPPIESITLGTDIRSFLQKGVPLELTRAALRRAWTTDPAIRDFIEVAENQWDFATGKGLPGFGPLEATDDVRRLVAEVFQSQLPPLVEQPGAAVGAEGEPGPGVVVSKEPQTASFDTKTLDQPVSDMRAPSGVGDAVIVHREKENVAMQQETKSEDSVPPAERRHGRALPQ